MSEYNAKNYTEQGGDVTHIGGKLIIEDGASVEGLPDPGGYVLPVASSSQLGGVRVGERLSITDNGVLSKVPDEAYVLPAATADKLGGVRYGVGFSDVGGGKIMPNTRKVQVYRISVSGTTANNDVVVRFPVYTSRSILMYSWENELERFCILDYENGTVLATKLGVGNDNRAYFHVYSGIGGNEPKEYIFGIACVNNDAPDDLVYIRNLSLQ